MACEEIKAKLDALIVQSNNINQELQNTRDPSDRAALQSALRKLVPQILDTQRLLAECLNQVSFPGSPAILIDMALPNVVSIDINNPKITALQGQVQQRLMPLSASLAPSGKILVGPNFVLATDSLGRQVLRIGIWIEDPTFPVIPASPPDFPLPLLSAQSASAGFNAADFLPVPEAGLFPFALSIPVTTFQFLLNAIFPTLQVAASQKNVSLKSATVQTNGPDKVTVRFDGDLPITSFNATFTEVLGTQQLPDTIQSVPAVIKSDYSTSVSDLLGWVVGAFFPLYGVVLLGVWGVVSSAAGGISGTITGIVGSLIAKVPPRIPFQNTMFPSSGIHIADFPALVFDWKAFGATDSGIFGNGTMTIEARDQNEVTLTVSGSGFITGFQKDLAGGAVQTYNFTLDNLAPDPDKFGWQTSGTGSDKGSINRAPLSQAGDFEVDFPLPFNVAPGNFPFTLAINATETCGSDPSKTLSSSFSKEVQVEVKKNPNEPP